MTRKYRRMIFVLLILNIILAVFISNISSGSDTESGSDTAPEISDISVSDITDTSAKIIFTVNQSDANTIVRYDIIRTRLRDASDWNNDTSFTRTIILTGLQRSRTYYYSIYAYNENDPSKSSDSPTQSFRTLSFATPEITAPEISDINVDDTTSSTANISFRVDQNNADTRIYYGTTESLGTWSDWDNRTSFQRKIMLSDLLSETEYYYSIYAYNGDDPNESSNSPTQSFRTSEITVPNISNINVDDTTSSTANISFRVGQNNADTRIYYGTTESLGTWSDWNNRTSFQRKIMLSDLLSETKYYYSIYAYNGDEPNYYSNSTIDSFVTEPSDDIDLPDIVYTSPEQTIRTTVDESVNFAISFDQDVNVTWYLNVTIVKGPIYSVRHSSYLNDTPSVGIWNVTAIGENEKGIVSYSWTWIVQPGKSRTGNRIWDGTKNMSTTYIWNSYSFAGFYYDIDSNISTEELTIRNIKRTIERGDITYATSPIEVSFDYSGFGKYQVIGFLADKYFAGYTTNSVISNKRDISSLGSGQLHRVLIDDEDKRTVTVGGTLTLKEGYVLKMKEIDIGAGTGQIWVGLLKDGGEVDNAVVSAGNNYIYSRRVGTTDSLPIIAVHFESVFRGRETNAVFAKGVFQISDSYTEVRSGSRYGKMEVASVSRDQITMENRETVSLSARSKIDLMGNLKIIVANSDTLRFELSVDRSDIGGTFEARGTVYPIVSEWTPLNFGLDVGGKTVGFYYNIDEDIGTEKLKVKNSGRSITKGNLIYSTSSQEVSFDCPKFGKYSVIGFMAEKYFAGYTSGSVISDNKYIDTIGNGQLHRVLIDDNEQRVISVGGTLSLKEGYVLKAKEIDIGAGSGQVWIVLLKDGNEVDNDVVGRGDVYTYKKRVGTVDGLPLIAVRVDSVFRGTEVNAAFFKGIFQISDSYTEARNGNTYGKMEISEVSRGRIAMENKNDISLSSGSTIDIMGNIKFKVADSSDLRFYPYVLVTPDMVVNQLVIDAPAKATAGDTIDIRVTAGGVRIEGVSISIEPEVGVINNVTSEDGILNFTLPITLKGTYNIIATKIGYQNAKKTIEIEKYIDKKLSLDIPININQFETISIKVISNDENNKLISGVKITYDNDTIGLTDNNGILNYTLQSSGNHTLTASKIGYITVVREIYVREPYSEFKALDINITPNIAFENEKILIISNITNIGTKVDTTIIELVSNDNVVNNKSITLYPKETKEINFTYKAVEGNYTIKILEQEGLLEVKKAPLNVLLIAAIFTIIGIVAIYMVTARDKIAELIKRKHIF